MPSRPPIIFLHGAHSDARVWQAGFLQSFEQRGWTCHALDLPGHGRRRDECALEDLGLADYVRAVRAAVDACDQPPVLVGHSMGGFLAQDFLLSGGQASALALLASAPPQGMARDIMAFAFRHPMLALRMEFPGSETTEGRLRRIRATLMTEATPDHTVAWVVDQLQRESPRAVRELGMHSLHARPLDLPVLAIAGGQDKLIGLESQRAMAKAYGVPLQVHADMGHMLSLEPGWQQVADEVAAFLDQGLPRNR